MSHAEAPQILALEAMTKRLTSFVTGLGQHFASVLQGTIDFQLSSFEQFRELIFQDGFPEEYSELYTFYKTLQAKVVEAGMNLILKNAIFCSSCATCTANAYVEIDLLDSLEVKTSNYTYTFYEFCNNQTT